MPFCLHSTVNSAYHIISTSSKVCSVKKVSRLMKTGPPSVPTVATLQVHNSTLSSNSRESLKSDHDNASVTTETSGYASAVNDGPLTNGDDFRSSFRVLQDNWRRRLHQPLVLNGSGKDGSNRDELGSGRDDGDGRSQFNNFFGSDAVSEYIHPQLHMFFEEKMHFLCLRVIIFYS